MKSLMSTLSPTARAWGKTIAILGGTLGIYLSVALLGTWLTRDAVAGAALAAIAVAILAIVYRWKSTGTPLASAPAPRARTKTFWFTAVTGLILCWMLGQTAATWVYDTVGSPAFDSMSAVKQNTTAWLLVLTMLFIAPIGEESLMRGIAYPALRKHWPPLAAAFVTAAVFALLHGNIVQIVVAFPLGILLAFVYEASQRLWPVIFMHVLFNMAASFVPTKTIENVAELPMVVCLVVAFTLVLFALTPGRYAVESHGKNDPPQGGGSNDSAANDSEANDSTANDSTAKSVTLPG